MNNITLNAKSDSNSSIELFGSYVELLFTTKSNIGWVFSTAIPTGWVLLIIMVIIIIFALPVFRNKGYFEVN